MYLSGHVKILKKNEFNENVLHQSLELVFVLKKLVKQRTVGSDNVSTQWASITVINNAKPDTRNRSLTEKGVDSYFLCCLTG